MTDKSLIKKLAAQLQYGEQAKIARLTGISKPQVYRFFAGMDGVISEEKIDQIIEKTELIFKERAKSEARKTKRIEKLIKA